MFVSLWQGIRPAITPAIIDALYSYIESDVFRCSRRMPMESLAKAMSEEVVLTIPDVPVMAKVTLQAALREAKGRVEAEEALAVVSRCATAWIRFVMSGKERAVMIRTETCVGLRICEEWAADSLPPLWPCLLV